MGIMYTTLGVDTPDIAPDAVTSEKLDPTLVQYAEVEISAAEVLTLNSVKKVLLASPGAGYILELVSLFLAYDFNTTPYTIGSASELRVRVGGGLVSTTSLLATGFLDQSSDQTKLIHGYAGSPVADSTMTLEVTSGDVSVGDSPIHAKVAYRVHATDL